MILNKYTLFDPQGDKYTSGGEKGIYLDSIPDNDLSYVVYLYSEKIITRFADFLTNVFPFTNKNTSTMKDTPQSQSIYHSDTDSSSSDDDYIVNMNVSYY